MSPTPGPSQQEIQQMLLQQETASAGQQVVSPQLDPMAGDRTAQYTQALQQVGVDPTAFGPGINSSGVDVVQQTMNTIANNPTAVEGIGTAITDFIDNTFQGDQKSKEDIAAEVDQGRAEYAVTQGLRQTEERKDFEQQAPEAVKVFTGSATGAGEAAASTGALVADTVMAGTDRLFPQFALDVADEDNPFSN